MSVTFVKNIKHMDKLITDDIYQKLKAFDKGLTESKFSIRYLRTSRSYLSNRRNKRRDVSNDVLLKLHAELSRHGSRWQVATDRETDERRRERWQQRATLHHTLASDVMRRLIGRGR